MFDETLLTQIITKCEEITRLCNELLGEVEKTARVAHVMACYLSRSGNETWRMTCEDGTQVWLRTTQRLMLEELGFWDELMQLPFADEIPVYVAFHTIPDGDFHKVVSIEEFAILLEDDDLS